MGDYYGHQQQQQSSAPQRPSVDAGKIFVGGLSHQTNEESLRFHFEQYGAVVSVEVMRDRVTGDHRGFAFVVFSDPNTVDLVMADERHEINHKLVDVKKAQARGQAPPSIHQGGTGNQQNRHTSTRSSQENDVSPEQAQAKVFVGGLPPHVDRDELRQIFSEFGPVTDAIVMVDQQTQRSRGFGFVTFETTSDGALRAVAAQPLQIHGRRVEVKLATPRAEQARRGPAAPKHVGLRAGQTTSTGEFAGLAVAYGRDGWKAGYGSKAFGRMGWNVQGWDDGGPAPEKTGFSFAMLKQRTTAERPPKRARR